LGDRPGENDGGAKDASNSTDATPDSTIAPDSSTSDSGTDGSDDGGAWTPKQLAGLELWLDSANGVVADLASPGRATKWLDQSGKGHDAKGVEGGGGFPLPKIQAAGIGQKNTVVCETQSYFELTDAPGFQFGTGDWGIIIVAKFSYSSGVGGPFFYVKSNAIRLDINGSGNFGVYSAGAVAAVANVSQNAFHIMTARGAKVEARAAGNIATGQTSTQDISVPNAPVMICGSSVGFYTELAEMIVVKGTLTDTDLAASVGYLKDKYKL